MSVDLTNILAGLEAKIAAMDSNTPLDDMILNIKSYQEAGGKLSIIYDSAGELPAADSAYSGMLASTNTGLYVYDSAWSLLDSDTYTAPPVPVPQPFVWQGSTSGYMQGGFSPYSNVIQSYSFTADGNAVDIGDLLTTPYGSTGSSDGTSGFAGGGQTPSYTTQLNKFPFAAGGNATDAGDLSSARGAGGPVHTEQTGYMMAGRDPSGNLNTIEKYPHATGTGVEVTATTQSARNRPHGSGSSTTHGYVMGGYTSSAVTDIDKMPFASEDAASDVGDLNIAAYTNTGGVSSTTHAYSAGNWPGSRTTRLKVSFASDGNSVTAGAISYGRYGTSGTSSTTHGYTHGGVSPAFSGSYTNIIDKFPYASDTDTSTDVGDATQSPGIANAAGVHI